MRFAVIDTETTGLYSADRVIEIAVVMLDEHGETLDEWDTLLDPGRDVGPVDIHGVTATMVAAAPTFEDVRWALAERLDEAVLVAHNLGFDQRMLDGEFTRSRGGWSPGQGVCTLRTLGGKLASACAQHGVDVEQEHRALSDARATAQLFVKTVLQNSGSTIPARVDGAEQKRIRTLRREAFPDRPHWQARDSAVSRWAISIDHRRYPLDDRGYIDLLDRALDDLWLDAEERTELQMLAALAGIPPARQPELHRRYVDDLYAAAMRDSVITDDEFRQLDAVTQALGFRLGELYPDFELYRPQSVEVADIAPGSRIAFTGTAIDPHTGHKLDRSELADRCTAAGMIPEDGFAKSTTDLLVAADPSSQSGKAKKARQWGIPVMSVEDFLSALADR